MYIFEANYINYKTDETITRTIEFSENFFDSEKDCYLYAMSRAYDLCGENEFFSNLDLIAC